MEKVARMLSLQISSTCAITLPGTASICGASITEMQFSRMLQAALPSGRVA